MFLLYVSFCYEYPLKGKNNSNNQNKTNKNYQNHQQKLKKDAFWMEKVNFV